MSQPLNVQHRERTNTNPASEMIDETHTYLLSDVLDDMRAAGSPLPLGQLTGVDIDSPNILLTFLNPTYPAPEEPPVE